MSLLRAQSGDVRPVWKLGGFLGMAVAAFGLTGVVVGLASAGRGGNAWTTDVRLNSRRLTE